MQNLNQSLNESLQAKYPHLELSVLSFSQVQKDNESKRIDSEYFKKEYLENETRLLNLNSVKLENFIQKMTGGATPLGANYPDSGIPFLRVQNIMQNYFSLNDIVYISKADDEALKRSRLNRGDMLLTITGAYGKAAVVEQDLEGANINQHSVKIETKDINPYFLATFINSKYGQLQCDKKITGVTRPALDYQVIKTFLIPQFSQDFQREIQKLVQDSHRALEDSKAMYKEAQRLLYESLELDSNNPLAPLQNDTHPLAPSAREGESLICTPQREGEQIPYHLKRSEVSQNHYDRDISVSTKPQYDKLDSSLFTKARNDKAINSPSLAEGARGWVNPHNDIAQKYLHLNISIRSLSQSYGKSGRLDSEYYQSKYDAIERKIRGFSHKKLGDLVTIQKSIEPGSEAYQDEGIEFVRVANLSKFGISKSDICLSERDFGKDLEKLAPKKETILLSKDGSIGISYCLEEDLECITSGAILHLKVKDKSEILPQVLSLILNSIVVKLQAERDSGGSIISHWKISEIENVLIPLLDFKLQEKIAQKIQKSFALRKESKDLLESAKAKVEQAIQNNAK